MQEKKTAVLVRLPDEIKQQLERVAQKSRRSINKQLIFIIEDWLDLTRARNKSEMSPGEDKISAFSSGVHYSRGGKEAIRVKRLNGKRLAGVASL